MATNKIQTGIRFEPEVLYKIGYIAKENVRSLNAQLEFLAKECIKQYEEELSWKLLTDDEAGAGVVAKFNTTVLLRTEFQTMIQTLAQAVQNFIMTPNEARERIDLPHKDGGDNLLGNGNAIPVQYVGTQYTAGQAQPQPAAESEREEEKAWLKSIIQTTLKEMLE